MLCRGPAVRGGLSARVGRRPILLTTMVINAAGYVLFALAGSYPVLFVARLVSGFAGGNISAAQAYVADITTPAERSKGMGIVGAAFGLGFIVGPALGGLAAHYGGHLAPGLVAAGAAPLPVCSPHTLPPRPPTEEHPARPGGGARRRHDRGRLRRARGPSRGDGADHGVRRPGRAGGDARRRAGAGGAGRPVRPGAGGGAVRPVLAAVGVPRRGCRHGDGGRR